MSYSKFTLAETVSKFDLRIEREAIFGTINPIKISDFLKESLHRGTAIALPNGSEKARSELLVSPFLVELKQLNPSKIGVFSGEILDVDKKKGLNGECDFILTRNSNQLYIDSPNFTIVEAKKNDIGEAFGQCIAQMIGAKLYNEARQKPINILFGCVTTGDRWHFLKLENNVVTITPKDITLDNNEELILGTLQEIVNTESV